MFTGLIEEVGTLVAVRTHHHGTELRISAPGAAKHVNPGESIAVNGCCLTLTSCRGDCLTFDLLDETIARTNLRALQQDSPVNLERALRTDARLGGHFVQGHVDCVAPILAFERKGADFRLELALPKSYAHFVASKGSIAVNGISLTAYNVKKDSFRVAIIPYTFQHTNLHNLQEGDTVNLEFDMIGKYILRKLSLEK